MTEVLMALVAVILVAVVMIVVVMAIRTRIQSSKNRHEHTVLHPHCCGSLLELPALESTPLALGRIDLPTTFFQPLF